MENKENEPIKDYKKVSSKRLIITVIKVLIIIYIVNSAITIYNKCNEIVENEQNKIEMTKEIEENNRKVVLVYDFDDEYVDVKNMEEIKYDNGINIPTLRKYKKVDGIVSYDTARENNIVARQSPVVKFVYINDLCVDMYKTELVKQDGYTRLMHQNLRNKFVYVRQEKNGYFSYVIIEGCNVTFGISYGDPVANIEINKF